MCDPSEIWTGKASSYDRARPTPPPALLDLLTQVIQMPHPALVVDVGSGTGLSTAIWGERAERMIGIEPNADMRKEAVHKVEDHPYAAQIEYHEGVAHQTGCLMGALISSLLPNRSTGWNRLRPWPRSLGFCDPEDSLLRMTMIDHQHSIGSLIGSPRRLVSA